MVQVSEDVGTQPYHDAPQPPIQLLGLGLDLGRLVKLPAEPFQSDDR